MSIQHHPCCSGDQSRAGPAPSQPASQKPGQKPGGHKACLALRAGVAAQKSEGQQIPLHYQRSTALFAFAPATSGLFWPEALSVCSETSTWSFNFLSVKEERATLGPLYSRRRMRYTHSCNVNSQELEMTEAWVAETCCSGESGRVGLGIVFGTGDCMQCLSTEIHPQPFYVVSVNFLSLLGQNIQHQK